MNNKEKPGLKARLIDETKLMVFVTVYLAILLCAFTTYRRLLLAEYRIPFVQYSYSIIEALVLAKVILIGRAMRIGRRFDARPMIFPTLYKTLCFSILILGFSVLEHVIVGKWHGENAPAIIDRIFSAGKWEIMARVLVLFAALVPMFALWEIAGLVGGSRLFEQFFQRRIAASGADSIVSTAEKSA